MNKQRLSEEGKHVVPEKKRHFSYMCQGSVVESNGGSILVEVSLDHTHSLFHPHSSQTHMLSSPKQVLGR